MSATYLWHVRCPNHPQLLEMHVVERNRLGRPVRAKGVCPICDVSIVQHFTTRRDWIRAGGVVIEERDAS